MSTACITCTWIGMGVRSQEEGEEEGEVEVGIVEITTLVPILIQQYCLLCHACLLHRDTGDYPGGVIPYPRLWVPEELLVVGQMDKVLVPKWFCHWAFAPLGIGAA